MKQIFSEQDMGRILDRIAYEIVERCTPVETIGILGIRTRGMCMAERLCARVASITGHTPPMGVLDITLYRDDLESIPLAPIVRKTDIPYDITDKTIVLVDDVLYTGRTIRAALDQIMDFGRPRRVALAVLIDRPGRELPIQADFVGNQVHLPGEGEQVAVHMKEVDNEDGVFLERSTSG